MSLSFRTLRFIQEAFASLAPRKKILISFILILFLFLPNADERSILSDLDLDFFASRFLNLSFVIGFVPLGFFGGFGDSSSTKIVLDGLLHRRWHITHLYLLLVFVFLIACINQGRSCHDSQDGGCHDNSCFHWVGSSLRLRSFRM